MTLDYTTVQGIIDGKAWATLIGESESDAFDCKKVIYDLRVDAQKQELAKDVSSFANSEGGFILLGIETIRSASHPGDEVSALCPFPETLLNPKQYLDILDGWLIPKLDGVAITWVPEADGATNGFGVIAVPPQSVTRKPFVIVHTVLESGRRRDLLVGFAQRKRDTSQPATPAEVGKWLVDGRNFQDSIGTKLDEILSRMDAGMTMPGNAVNAGGPDDEEVARRIDDALAKTGLREQPHFVLAAAPEEPTQLKSLFKSGPGTITQTLEDPPVLRYAGWSLETLDQARIVEGRFRQLTNGDRKVLRLYRDAVLLHAVSGGPDFLGWGMSSEEFRENPRLVSLAVIEVTYLFCLFYAEVLKDLTVTPKQIRFNFRLGGMQNSGTKEPVYLNPYGVRAIGFAHNREKYAAQHDAGQGVVVADVATFDPALVAYRLVEEIYLWFGVEPSKIPYTEDRDGIKAIDPAKIIAS